MLLAGGVAKVQDELLATVRPEMIVVVLRRKTLPAVAAILSTVPEEPDTSPFTLQLLVQPEPLTR